MPNSSRTFTILSGEAITVSAAAFEADVGNIGHAAALSEARRPPQPAATFCGSGNRSTKRLASFRSPSTPIVSNGAPPWITAGDVGRRAGEGDVAVHRSRRARRRAGRRGRRRHRSASPRRKPIRAFESRRELGRASGLQRQHERHMADRQRRIVAAGCAPPSGRAMAKTGTASSPHAVAS